MKPKFSNRTLSALQRIITGNPVRNAEPISPYRSGPDLVEFFNEFGANDRYNWKGGFPARWMFAEQKLEELNATEELPAVVEAAVNPADYLDSEHSVGAVVEYLNKYLHLEGYQLIASGEEYKLRPTSEKLVSVEAPLAPENYASHEFIVEQIEKCDDKLARDDYDGAITNSRSAVEAVLCDIESRLDSKAPEYNGDIQKLYKRVQKLLNLEPSRPDINNSLRQLLQGLTSIVAGLAPLRNKMGDAHVRSYKPSRHHAKLAVNAAKTILDFIYDTFEYQKERGTISEIEP